MPRQMITYADFRGGLNTESANDVLADSELVIAENVDLTERGALVKRAGLRPFNAEPYKLYEHDVVILQLVPWDGQLFAVVAEVGDETGTRVLCLISDAGLVPVLYDYQYQLSATVVGRKLIVHNNSETAPCLREVGRTSAAGEDPQYHPYDLLASAEKPTITKQGTGALVKGLYVFVVRYVNALGYESVFDDRFGSGQYTVATIDAGTTVGSFEWSDIATGPTGTVSRRLYRSGPLGMTDDPGYLRWNFDMHLVGTINDNTTTTFSDTTSADVLITRPKMEPRDNILATKICSASQFAWHPASGRYFASGIPGMESAIFYSEPMRFDSWKASSVMHTMGHEAVTPELLAFGDAVLAFYPDGVYAWRGTDSMDATWEQIALPVNSAKNPVLTPESVVFVADNGVWAIPQSGYRGNLALVPGADKAANLAEGKVRNLFKGLHAQGAVFSPIYDAKNGRYMLRYIVGAHPDLTAGVLVYDWSLQAWTHYTGMAWAASTWCRGHDGAIYLAGGGNIWYLDPTATSDGGGPIKAHIRTKGYDLGIPTWKWVSQLFASFGQHAVPLSGITGKVGTGYDTLAIPAFTWATSGDLKQQRIPAHKKGQRFAVEFEHESATEPFALYSVGFVFQPLMPRGL